MYWIRDNVFKQFPSLSMRNYLVNTYTYLTVNQYVLCAIQPILNS